MFIKLKEPQSLQQFDVLLIVVFVCFFYSNATMSTLAVQEKLNTCYWDHIGSVFNWVIL